MASVVDQWKRAAREGLNPEGDRLVAVTSRPSEAIRRLGDALEANRRQVAAKMTGPPLRALAKLRGLLADLPPDLQRDIVRMAVVLPLASEEEGVLDAGTGELLLDGYVVAQGEGRVAWRCLVRHARKLAAKRSGGTAGDWTGLLREERLTIVADAAGAASARLEAQRLATGRYRQHLVERASWLELIVGAGLPPLPFSEAGMTLQVTPDLETGLLEGGSGSGSGRPELAFRRRGRSILTGLPGSGKTTTLVQAAGFWAGRDDWPIPLFIRLSDFARRMDQGGALDLMIEIAMEDVAPEDRVLVEGAIRAGIRTGTAALFLDGLDETRELRRDVVARIRRALEGAHPDVEVVVSTRDIAYADARSLRFASVRLTPPEHTEKALERILQASADVMQVPSDEQGAWVGDRLAWIVRACEDQEGLRETALMQILLAVLAGERHRGALPTDPAHVLKEIVVNVVRQWEARRGTPRVGQLEGEEAIRCLLDVYEWMSEVLAARGVAPLEEVSLVVADMLKGERWGLPPARAEATASESLTFWDEAGIFVAGGAPAVIEPRIRLFVEVGEAMRVARLPAELQREWVRIAVSEADSHETLGLAALLSRAVAEALLEEAVRRRSRSLDALSVRCLRQGADVSQARVLRLAHNLERRMGLQPPNAWEATRLLAELPLPLEIQDRVLGKVEALPDPHETVARALLLLKWGREGQDVDSVLLRLLEIDRLPSLKTTQSGGGIKDRVFTAVVDEGYVEAMLLAAARILPAHPELANRLVEIGHRQLPFSMVGRMDAILIRMGYGDLVQSHWTRQAFPDFGDWERQYRAAWGPFLASVRNLAAPVRLTPGQARRLDELASLIASFEIAESTSGFEVAASKGGQDLDQLVAAYADLGGFDRGLVAAEAESLPHLEPGGIGLHTLMYVFDHAEPASLDWGRVADRSPLRDILVRLLGSYEWIAHAGARALAGYPDKESIVRQVEVLLPTLRARNRRIAGWVVMLAESNAGPRVEAWLTGPDPVLRTIAGRVLAAQWKEGIPARPDLLKKALADPDDTVRLSMVEQLRDVDFPPDTRRWVRRSKQRAPSGWQCPECDTQNAAESEECAGCHLHARHVPIVIS